MTVRQLRLLQIGGLAVICLALVTVSILGGRCSAPRDGEKTDGTEAAALFFHATELKNAFTDAGFAADGNLYAYTLTLPGESRFSCDVRLSTTDAVNDTLELQFTCVRAASAEGGSAIEKAIREQAEAMRPLQEKLLNVLTAAMKAAGVQTDAEAVRDGVLRSVDSGDACSLKTDAFVMEGGFPDASSAGVYVLRVQIRAAQEM